MPVRWTATQTALPGHVDQTAATTSSTLNADRLMSGVTLRQTKISDSMLGTPAEARPRSESNSDSDDDDDNDDDDDSEVGVTALSTT